MWSLYYPLICWHTGKFSVRCAIVCCPWIDSSKNLSWRSIFFRPVHSRASVEANWSIGSWELDPLEVGATGYRRAFRALKNRPFPLPQLSLRRQCLPPQLLIIGIFRMSTSGKHIPKQTLMNRSISNSLIITSFPHARSKCLRRPSTD